MDSFKAQYGLYKRTFEEYLISVSSYKACRHELIYEAASYSLLAGGKRIRPVIMLAFGELLDVPMEEVLPFAAALEMIHTYSLIHDDLPAMDNDNLRRGKPTNHVVYGEATAILAGDTLLNWAFEHVLEVIVNYEPESIKNAVKALELLAECAGKDGMIAGQIVDMLSQNKEISFEDLLYLHENKTGALLKAACMIPVILAGQGGEADDEVFDKVNDFAYNIGLMFQVKDDILDVEGDTAVLGKKVGSDSEQGKTTFVSMLGMKKCREYMDEYKRSALGLLNEMSGEITFLKSMVEYFYGRES